MADEIQMIEKEEEELKNKIKSLKEKKTDLQNKMKEGKKVVYSNTHIRVANICKEKFDYIDKKRKELGLNPISNPKKTKLILRHKHWGNIEKDIINFHTEGDEN